MMGGPIKHTKMGAANRAAVSRNETSGRKGLRLR